MTISTGDKFPSVTVKTMGENGPEDVNLGELMADKKVVLFAVPGAFTPGCTVTHLPGFVVNADVIKSKGVDVIACVAVNDAFVMSAWGKSQNADEILMLADGNSELVKTLGMELDLSAPGLGVRSKRYAMIVENGTVTYLGVDAKEIVESSAETVLAQL